MKFKKMKSTQTFSQLFVVSLFIFIFLGTVYGQAALPPQKTIVVYFGQQNQEAFEQKIKPIFAKESCKACEIVNFTPYAKDGTLDLAALRERIEGMPEDISFVFFDFNLKFTDENKVLVEVLNKKIEKGLVVVGAAGSPKPSDSSSPLNRTVLGQIKSALIIGELGDRDRLMPTAFYGPEMLTAIRPPKDKMGQGYSPLIFAANLAENWQKRSSQEWTDYLKKKKAASRKLWLDMSDMF